MQRVTHRPLENVRSHCWKAYVAVVSTISSGKQHLCMPLDSGHLRDLGLHDFMPLFPTCRVETIMGSSPMESS